MGLATSVVPDLAKFRRTPTQWQKMEPAQQEKYLEKFLKTPVPKPHGDNLVVSSDGTRVTVAPGINGGKKLNQKTGKRSNRTKSKPESKLPKTPVSKPNSGNPVVSPDATPGINHGKKPNRKTGKRANQT